MPAVFCRAPVQCCWWSTMAGLRRGVWPGALKAPNTVLVAAERSGRAVALLSTAPDETGAAPQATPPVPAADLRAKLAALHPEPWPPDRASAATALINWRRSGTAVVYLSDGLTHAANFSAFAD